ncbi:Integrase-like protein [Gossypium australe]|uniref:Integrase-like protein n=1 Tax=Gossypium australe TaxID=47621 RepID=A0A5B6V416_9ROSI|nr:Integrase-like protein [Gossypium australe]
MSSTPDELYPDLEQLLRHNHPAMNNDPSAGKLIIVEPREQQGHNREKVPIAQRTLCEYILPTPDAVGGSTKRPTINANNFEIKTTTVQMIQNLIQFKGKMVEDPN